VIRQEPVKPTSTPPKAKEKVVGKKLDVAKAKKKQKVLTPKRPFSLKQLRQKQIRELENLMDEMRMR
jgi:DNA topoisomerase IA